MLNGFKIVAGGAYGARGRCSLGVTMLAFDRNGRAVVRDSEGINAALEPASPREQPNGPIFIAQQISMRRGDAYLYVATWDRESGRLGTVQPALEVH